MHQKIKFIPMKIHETVTTRAAPFGPDMHQIVCRLAPDPLAGLRGPTSKGKGREGEGSGPTSKGRGGEEREQRGGDGRERRKKEGEGEEGREEGD